MSFEITIPTSQRKIAGATELLVEPHAEIVQSDPRRQARAQTLKLVGPLLPQTEGVEELVVESGS